MEDKTQSTRECYSWIDEHFPEDIKKEDKEPAELDIDYITMLQELEGK